MPKNNTKVKNIRNIAIIAHVDHGKTTLVDSMFAQTGVTIKGELPQHQSMDTNELEQERGITILSKCTSVQFEETTINIVDTPGHADFGSEVERILKMVDGVLLVVDAVEGPMPQTKFVLRKALEQKLPPIVVINKMDRPHIRPQAVLDEVSFLLIDLGAEESQLDFPVLYAAAKHGWASKSPNEPGKDLSPLMHTIIESISPPQGDPSHPLQLLVTMLDDSNYLGKIGIGRILNGSMSQDKMIARVRQNGKVTQHKITRIMDFAGLSQREIKEASAGEIVAFAGVKDVDVGDTIASMSDPVALPPLKIDEPTLSMNFIVNDSPFCGQDGKFVTSRHLKARLEKEQKTNVGLRIEQLPGEGQFKVSGRGELHLSILLETMRREGYELAVSRPEVIYKKENGVIKEPIEYLYLDIESAYQGAVFEAIGQRGALMKNMHTEGANRVRLEYTIAARCLIGFKSEFMTITRGTGIMYHAYHGHAAKSGNVPLRKSGVLVAKEPGTSTAYALYNLQDRSTLFIGPTIDVYTGMIVGANSRENDLVVNPCKQKNLTNMRTKAADTALVLTPPKLLTLEQAIEFIDSDELVEVTPSFIRLRKKILDESRRKRAEKSSAANNEP